MSSITQTAKEHGQVGDAALMKRLSWKIVPFLIVLYFVSYLDRVNISFASLQMNADVGLSSIAYGFGASIFFIGYFLFEVPSNLVLSKVGARRWIARIMITWGIVSFCMIFVRGPKSFYLLRFLLGVSEAGFFPGIMIYIGQWFPVSYRARVTGVFMISIPLSGLIGSPISGLVLDGLNNFLGLRGWQWMFIIEAVPALILGLLCLRMLADKPSEVSWLGAPEKARLEHLLETERRALEAGGKYKLSAAFTNPAVVLLAGTLFCIVFGVTGIAFFLPQIIKSFGYTNTVVGFLSAVPFLCGAIAMVAWGRHSDARGERIGHLMAALVLAALGFIVMSFLLSMHIVAMLGLIMAAMGVFAANVVLWSLPTALLTGTTAAAAVAFINSVANLSGVVAPSLIGWSRQVTGGFATTGFIFLGFMALGMVLVLLFCTTTLYKNAMFKARAVNGI